MAIDKGVVGNITGNFGRLRGVPEGAEPIFGVDLGAIVGQLLEGMLNSCLSNLGAAEAAEKIKNPDPVTLRQFKAAAMIKARQAIKEGPKRGRKRRAFAKDLVASMQQEAAERTYSETVHFIESART